MASIVRKWSHKDTEQMNFGRFPYDTNCLGSRFIEGLAKWEPNKATHMTNCSIRGCDWLRLFGADACSTSKPINRRADGLIWIGRPVWNELRILELSWKGPLSKNAPPKIADDAWEVQPVLIKKRFERFETDSSSGLFEQTNIDYRKVTKSCTRRLEASGLIRRIGQTPFSAT